MNNTKDYENSPARRAYKLKWQKENRQQIKFYIVTQPLNAITDQGEQHFTPSDQLFPEGQWTGKLSCPARNLTGILIHFKLRKRKNSTIKKHQTP